MVVRLGLVVRQVLLLTRVGDAGGSREVRIGARGRSLVYQREPFPTRVDFLRFGGTFFGSRTGPLSRSGELLQSQNDC